MSTNNTHGTNIAKLDLVKNNPAAAAIISKAINSHINNGVQFNLKNKGSIYAIDQNKINSISEVQKNRLKENEDILELFPDIQLAEQIIVSSILAPKDMFTGNLIYQTLDNILPESIQTKINEVVRRHLESYYDIRSELPEILKAAIFRTGSYVSAVIPEAAVDQVINGQTYSNESHGQLILELIDQNGNTKSLGLLGPATNNSNNKTALENFFNGTYSDNSNNYIDLSAYSQENFGVNNNTSKYLEITDNFQIIKLPNLLKAISKQRVKRAIRNPQYTRSTFATEDFSIGPKIGNKKLTDTEFKELVYKNIKPDNQPFTIFPGRITQKRRSIGRPLRIRIPSESVIPVYPPGDPSNHRGYFILVDADGNWVTKSQIDSSDAGLQGLLANNSQTNNLTGTLLEKTRKNLTDDKADITIDNMLQIYSSIVEADMLSRLKNGIYGSQMELGKDKEWDRIMLARALAGKMTRIVYMPSELITYYAFDYHRNGIGKSYLDQVKLITSLRAILLFGKVSAEMKNAINVTKVDMKLDPEDPDPQKTISIAQHDIMRMRESFFPLGVNSPADLLQWIQRAGLMFAFSNHPGLPDTAFEFSNANLQHSVPDNQTNDDLRKQTFMTFGLSPEQIDEGFTPQFATTVISNNALFAKRISLLSDKTALHLTNDIRNIIMNDGNIVKDILEVLRSSGDAITKYLDDNDKNYFAKDKEAFLHSFIENIIENIWVDLPKPNVGSNTIKSEDFNNFSTAVDSALNSIISTEVFPESLVGSLNTHVDEIKAFWKHHILRKWMMDEGYMPELQELYKTDENGAPSNDVLDLIIQHVKSVMLSSIKYLKEGHNLGDAITKDLNRLGIKEGELSEPLDEETGDEFDLSGTTEETGEEDTNNPEPQDDTNDQNNAPTSNNEVQP